MDSVNDNLKDLHKYVMVEVVEFLVVKNLLLVLLLQVLQVNLNLLLLPPSPLLGRRRFIRRNLAKTVADSIL